MNKFYLSMGLILTLGLSAFAQNEKTASNEAPRSQKARAGSSSASTTDAAAGSLLQAGTSLEAQLQSMVDVKKSKVGDEVILKTTKSIKQNGEVIVPKGTQLIGRITEVQQRTKENAVSKVGIIFDRIHGKNLDVPFNASIVSVAAANANAAAGDLLSADLSGSGSGSATASRSGSTGGGGLLGGGGGGLLGGVGSTVNSTVGTATNTVGSVTNTAVNTVGHTTGTIGRTVNGLHISQSASGSASSSSTISAPGKDVRIEKGATFHLKVDSMARGQE